MNLHAAAAYMIHMLKARSTAGHGVHSPFMYRFITEVLGGRTDRVVTREVESLRRKMLSDTRMIRVRDLGAGSAVMRGEERRISRIASVAALPARDVALLTRVAGNLDMIRIREMGTGPGRRSDGENRPGMRPDREIQTDPGPDAVSRPGQRQSPDTGAEPQTGKFSRPGQVILELGTSLGISTLALALAAPDRRVISVEGSPELAAIARQNLLEHGALNAEVLCMEFGDALRHLNSLGIKVEMAFVDGNHRGIALADYVQTIRKMGEEMIIVADDIRMNKDMRKMWEILTGERNERTTTVTRGDQGVHAKNHLQSLSRSNIGTTGEREFFSQITFQPAHVSLETFRLGMLFFLRNLTPGHYRTRC